MAEIKIDSQRVKEVWVDNNKCKEVWIDGCKISFAKTWTSDWIFLTRPPMGAPNNTPAYYDLNLYDIDELIAVGLQFRGGTTRSEPLTAWVSGSKTPSVTTDGIGFTSVITGTSGRASFYPGSYSLSITGGGTASGTSYNDHTKTVTSTHTSATVSASGPYYILEAGTRHTRTYYTTHTKFSIAGLPDLQIFYFGDRGRLPKNIIVPLYHDPSVPTIAHPLSNDPYFFIAMLGAFQAKLGTTARLNFVPDHSVSMPVHPDIKIFLFYRGNKLGDED